jgi:hypothetical protein
VLDILSKCHSKRILIPVEGSASRYSGAVEDKFIISNMYQRQKGIPTTWERILQAASIRLQVFDTARYKMRHDIFSYMGESLRQEHTSGIR